MTMQLSETAEIKHLNELPAGKQGDSGAVEKVSAKCKEKVFEK